MSKFNDICNKIIFEYSQEEYNNKFIIKQSQQDINKAKQIFEKCTKDNEKALSRWQKNITKNKISIYNSEKKKVLTVAKEKFEKNPQKYIKYAEKFLPEDDDEEINENEVDSKETSSSASSSKQKTSKKDIDEKRIEIRFINYDEESNRKCIKPIFEIIQTIPNITTKIKRVADLSVYHFYFKYNGTDDEEDLADLLRKQFDNKINSKAKKHQTHIEYVFAKNNIICFEFKG